MVQIPPVWQPVDAAGFWALVAAIGTVIAALAAVIAAWISFRVLQTAKNGLKSLGLTKTDITTRAEREARTCAIHRAIELAVEILPENWEILAESKKSNVAVFIGDIRKVTFGDAAEKQQVAAARVWLATVPYEVSQRCSKLLNRLEAWSMFFMHELADTKRAGAPCAPVYCLLVMQLYPYLLDARANEAAGDFPNVVGLFQVWNESRETAAGELRAQELHAELERLQANRSRNPGPTPLGTKIDDVA